MANPIRTYLIRKTPNGPVIDTLKGVSHDKVAARAHGLHGRCVIEADHGSHISAKEKLGTAGQNVFTDCALGVYSTHGRTPYPTPGFEARRAALIAAHKANA